MKKYFLFILLFILYSESHACRCAFPDFETSLAIADFIFVGKAIKRDIGNAGVIFIFDIQETFKTKGDSELKRVTLHTGSGGGDCGAHFIYGETYLVYSRNQETNRCFPNSLLDDSYFYNLLRIRFDRTESYGKDGKTKLNEIEADFLNYFSSRQTTPFDFSGKSIIFFNGNYFFDKERFFKDQVFRLFYPQVVMLKNVQEFDAILVDRKKKLNRMQERKIKQKLINSLTAG